MNNESEYPREQIDSDNETLEVQLLVDEVLRRVDQEAAELGYSEAEKNQLLERIVMNVHTRLIQAELANDVKSFFNEVYRSASGQEDPSHDWMTQQQKSALQSGEEPFDVLYHRSEDGAGYLDPEFYLGQLALTIEQLDEATEDSDMAELLPILDRSRRVFMMNTREVSPVGYRHLAPTDVLRGKYGKDTANAFALGALAATEHLINPPEDKPKQTEGQ